MSLARTLYYVVKPHVPWRLRLAFRRWLAARTARDAQAVWPIAPGAGVAPEGWPGWPQGKRFAVALSHDVEGRAGVERVEALARLEMNLGFRSSFNFIPEGEYPPPLELFAWLRANGFEVGVHDLHHDGSLFRSEADFRRQAPTINRYLHEWRALGFRAGFMFHNLAWIGELHLEYDASTFDTDPFEPQPDGVGTIFPFWVPADAPRQGYVELPYTLPQDSTLFLLFKHRSADLWKSKADWVAAHGGMVLVNVHPDYLAFDGKACSERQFPAAIYSDLLTHLTDAYPGVFWHALPRDLAAWYREARPRQPSPVPVATVAGAPR